MPRPKRSANEPFYTRTTKGERLAIDELAKRHALKIGLSSTDLGVWFRAVVRDLAAADGISVVEPEEAAPAKAKAHAKKAARKR